MGMFSRLNRVIKSNLNALVEKAEDPEKLIGQTIRDMESEVKQAQRELVQTLGTAKRLLKEAKDHEEEVERWEEKAVLALQVEDDDLAKEALKRKHRARTRADDVRQQAYGAEQAAADMKDALDSVEQKIEDLKAKKVPLAQQVRRARENSESASGSGGRFGSGTFDELDRMTGRIDQLEAEVEASSVLDDPKRSEIEARFRRLEREHKGSHLDDELASLKAKLQK